MLSFLLSVLSLAAGAGATRYIRATTSHADAGCAGPRPVLPRWLCERLPLDALDAPATGRLRLRTDRGEQSVHFGRLRHDHGERHVRELLGFRGLRSLMFLWIVALEASC
jgi:hypothetical protein